MGNVFSQTPKEVQALKSQVVLRAPPDSLHRQFSHHLHPHAVLGRGSSFIPGDGSWSEDASGQHWCMEGHQPMDWWCGVYQLHGKESWPAQAYSLCPIPTPTLVLGWVP